METIDTLNPALTTRPALRLCHPEHPVSFDLLDRFAAGATTRDEKRLVVRHLLTGCASCRRRLGRAWPLESQQLPPDAYDQALDRSFDRLFQEMRVRSSAA
jgi:hypothetical protein